MAAYHLRAKVRSRGKSPISGLKHAAYLTRQAQAEGQVRRAAYGQEHVRYITREGHTRKDYIYHEHGNLPTWAEQNGLKFWASVDKHERMNSVIYREYEVMIPREISPEKWVPLAKEFTKQTLGDRHPYTLAVHCPTGRDGELQPHFHLQYSTRLHDGRERDESHYWKRVNTREPEQGGAPKERSWEKKERLYEVRREWAVLANTYLDRIGICIFCLHPTASWGEGQKTNMSGKGSDDRVALTVQT